MPKKKGAFYAYPSHPPALVETIEAAIRLIKKTNKVKVQSWRNLSHTGKYIVTHLTDAIRDAQIFACDLTYLNANVLFELGFAVARMKRIWVSIDSTVEGSTERYAHLNNTILPVIGYSGYSNRDDLVQAFNNAKPWIDISEPLLGPGFDARPRRQANPMLVYLKQPHDSDASVILSEILQESLFRNELSTDNPKDSPTNTLNWYAEKVRDSDAVLVHLLSDDRTDHEFHNLKCAFVAGLSVGFNKPTLMLAPDPYKTPVDYRGMLQVHRTAEECRRRVIQWLAEIEPHIPKRRPRRPLELDEGPPG